MLGGHGCTALLSWDGVHVRGKATWLLEATQGLNEQADKDWHHFEK
jgi:hypothetical protein